MMVLRWFGGFVVTALAVLGGAAHAQAPYPDRPVKIIVPYIAGSAPDVMARQVGERLGAALNQVFIIDNKPGASGNIGAEIAARAPADGYTLLLFTGNHVTNPLIFPKTAYDPLKDFVPITVVTRLPSLMVVPPSSPARTVAEFIALARSKPGKLNYGSGGLLSLANFSASAFRLAADIDYVHVPYKGAPDIVRGLLGEQIDVGFPTMPTAMLLAKEGKLRPLAVTSPKRTAAMPEVPTILESMPNGFSQESWLGLAAPAGTPPAIIERLFAVLKDAATDPAFRAKLGSDGSEVVFTTPAEFKAMLPGEIEYYRTLIKQLDIKPE